MRLVRVSIVLAVAALGLGGCVERFISVNSHPSGAIVWLNDEEVGATPLTVPFIWYGDYEVVLRKAGYETTKTSRRVEAPPFQWVGVDFFTECLWPGTFVDEHRWDFELSPQVSADRDALVERARILRHEAGDMESPAPKPSGR